MLQLIAYNQTNNSEYYLDIDSTENISLNFAVSEIKDFSSRKSSRSDSFSLPFTEKNNQFFTHFYNINASTGDFDIYKRTKCEIRVDSLPQIKGYLYINSINLTTKRFEVTVIGEVGNLKDELAEKKLFDLDSDWMDSFTHQLTKDNIVNSWDFNLSYNNTPADQDGIVYPFINYGIDNRVWTLGGSNSISSSSTPIQPYEFKPAFKVKTLFERILAEAGYSYDSDFLDNNDFDFDKIYMNLASEYEIVKYTSLNNGFKAEKLNNQLISTTSAVTISLTTEIYDPNNNYTNAVSTYTAPVDGTYVFGALIFVNFTRNDGAGETTAKYKFYLAVNGTTAWTSQDYFLQSASDGQTSVTSQTIFIPVNLLTNDNVTLLITAVNNTGDTALTDFNVINAPLDNSYWILLQQPNVPTQSNIYLSDNLPDIKQVDFLKAIFEHFNMFVEPKQDNPTELLIEPYPDYMDRGQIVDWTDKLDLSKEVQIIPTTDFRNKTLKFRWQEGKTYNAKYAQDIREKNYGEYIREDDSDLTQGEFQNFTVFAEPTNRLLNTQGTTQIYQICVMDLSARDQNGNVVPSKDKPRIFYFKKKDLDSSTQYYIFDDNTGIADAVTAYGYAGHYSDVPVTTGVFNLNWSSQSPIYNYNIWVDTPTKLNPFLQYWNSYYNEIYSQEARILKAKFYLTSTDIHNLRFNNKIFIKDTFYRINSITNYKPNSKDSCDVELIKIFEAKVGLGNTCDLTISEFLDTGLITFVDGTGTSASATKDCCEGYGYFWYAGENGGCYWKQILATNGDVFEPEPNDRPEG